SAAQARPISTSCMLAQLTLRRPCPPSARVHCHQPYSWSRANTACSSTWENSFASRKNQAYSDTIASPMGQHQGFCRTVSHTAMTPRDEAMISRGDMMARSAARCAVDGGCERPDERQRSAVRIVARGVRSSSRGSVVAHGADRREASQPMTAFELPAIVFRLVGGFHHLVVAEVPLAALTAIEGFDAQYDGFAGKGLVGFGGGIGFIEQLLVEAEVAGVQVIDLQH